MKLSTLRESPNEPLYTFHLFDPGEVASYDHGGRSIPPTALVRLLGLVEDGKVPAKCLSHKLRKEEEELDYEEEELEERLLQVWNKKKLLRGACARLEEVTK